ncbi:MAG: leucine-rich repeat protein [Bacilli bacterium]|nr:leucine-rich repeat protein [Bacilli bacterium]
MKTKTKGKGFLNKLLPVVFGTALMCTSFVGNTAKAATAETVSCGDLEHNHFESTLTLSDSNVFQNNGLKVYKAIGSNAIPCGVDGHNHTATFSNGTLKIEGSGSFDHRCANKFLEELQDETGVNIEFGDGIAVIERSTFLARFTPDNSKLTGVTFGTGLQELGGSSFEGCSNIKFVKFKGDHAPTIQRDSYSTGPFVGVGKSSTDSEKKEERADFIVSSKWDGVMPMYSPYGSYWEGGYFNIVITDIESNPVTVRDYHNHTAAYHNGVLTFSGTGKMDVNCAKYFLELFQKRQSYELVFNGIDMVGAYLFSPDNEYHDDVDDDRVDPRVNIYGDRITKVKFDDSLLTFDGGAFYNCKKLKRATLDAKKLLHIGRQDFGQCVNLKVVEFKNIPESSSFYIDSWAFEGVGTKENPSYLIVPKGWTDLPDAEGYWKGGYFQKYQTGQLSESFLENLTGDSSNPGSKPGASSCWAHWILIVAFIGFIAFVAVWNFVLRNKTYNLVSIFVSAAFALITLIFGIIGMSMGCGVCVLFFILNILVLIASVLIFCWDRVEPYVEKTKQRVKPKVDAVIKTIKTKLKLAKKEENTEDDKKEDEEKKEDK